MTTQAIVVEKYVMEEKDKRIAELTASLREACAALELATNLDIPSLQMRYALRATLASLKARHPNLGETKDE